MHDIETKKVKTVFVRLCFIISTSKFISSFLTMNKQNTLFSCIVTLVLIYFILVNIISTLAWKRGHYSYRRQQAKKNGFKIRSNKENVLNVIQPRIIGGRPAVWGEAPYYMRLETTFDGFTCGSCLMNYRGLRFVVTAAHCVWWGERNWTDIWAATVDPEYVTLIGADIDKDAYNAREQLFHADGIIIHQQYDPTWFTNDIAVVFLKEYAFESLGLERAAAPQIDWLDPEFAQIVGHGAKHRIDTQRYLQHIELEVLPRAICKAGCEDEFGINGTLQESQFCLSHPLDWYVKGLCFGDSGGPVIAYNYSVRRWYLAGVVSYASVHKCGSPGSFTLITKIAKFVPWIKKMADVWIEVSGGIGNPYNNTPDETDL